MFFSLSKTALQFVRAGGGVDLIVNGEQLAAGDFCDVVAVVSFDGKLDSMKLGHDLRKLILRQAEDHRDRLKLGNHNKTGGVGGVNDVSDVDESQADTAADRRSDVRVNDLKFRVVDGSLIGLDGAFKLSDLSLLRVDLLLGDDTFLEEQLVALVVDLHVAKLRLILGKLPFGLLQHNLVGPRIDLHQGIPLSNHLSFGEVDLDDLPIDAAANGDGVERRDRAEAIEVNG